jgi:hypothetical protein
MGDARRAQGGSRQRGCTTNRAARKTMRGRGERCSLDNDVDLSPSHVYVEKFDWCARMRACESAVVTRGKTQRSRHTQTRAHARTQHTHTRTRTQTHTHTHILRSRASERALTHLSLVLCTTPRSGQERTRVASAGVRHERKGNLIKSKVKVKAQHRME